MKTRRRQGQSVVEYILMVALLSGLTLGYVRFFTQRVWSPALSRLPAKVQACLSSGSQDQASRCR